MEIPGAVTHAAVSTADMRRHGARAVVSSAVGTTSEWYGLFPYGIAAVALLLFREFGTPMVIAAFMAVCALISLAALFALPHRSGDLDSR